jgi:hypothetical protein
VEPLKQSDMEKLDIEFPQQSKKRKAITKRTTKLQKGTTAYHIVKFMHAIMDTLDKHDMKGFFYRNGQL